ncbi:MAG: ABC transporter [Bacteroidetes bacterium HGW-Bacteroidetes-1]|jgi:ATP-binding cassette subfamily F protein uup|nr:MAG: ABC transporter [Bacteroidetes bacterium HGW-Bacteroidetes-1]
MNYLSVENISKNFGDKSLFENLSFGISKGDKTALIAVNGAGKTTLMRMLMGREEPDSGSITYADGIRVGFLEQHPQFDTEIAIDELVLGSHNEVLKAIRTYESVMAEHRDAHDHAHQKRLEAATSRMDVLHAWDYERRLKEMLTKFEIVDLKQKIGNLSGGQIKRLSLAMILLDEPELLLLDEPTNHLDIPMIEWLERFLKQSNITLLMVTHDRYFLDRVCNNILELFFGKLYHHKGNFTYYVEKSTEREATFRIEVEKAGQLLKQETEWMRRMPRARTTKSKSRIDAFYELKEKAGQRREQQQIQLEMTMNRVGSKILEMRNVSKRYGDVVILDGFDYMFTKGERIGIVGNNGVGKTSFLNLITEIETPDKGRVLSGDTIVYGYYTQQGIQFNEDQKVIDIVKEIADVIQTGNGTVATASQLLSRFMFPPQVQNQPVSLLSGGEKRRLYLLTVLVRNPNFLILDEPTNDLDLLTLQSLEEFIQSFPGCLLIVSHDRYFMDQVVDQLFVFEGNGVVKGFVGNYSDYREACDLKEKESRALMATAKSQKQTEQKNQGSSQQKKTKRSYKEQLEYEQIENDIDALEKEKVALVQKLNDSSIGYIELEKTSNRIAEIDRTGDEKMMRWLELDEIGREVS